MSVPYQLLRRRTNTHRASALAILLGQPRLRLFNIFAPYLLSIMYLTAVFGQVNINRFIRLALNENEVIAGKLQPGTEVSTTYRTGKGTG